MAVRAWRRVLYARGNKCRREPGIFRGLRESWCPEQRGEGSPEHAEQDSGKVSASLFHRN